MNAKMSIIQQSRDGDENTRIHMCKLYSHIKQIFPMVTIFQDEKCHQWDIFIGRLSVQIRKIILREYNKIEIQRQEDDIAAYMEERYLTPTVNYDSDFEIWADKCETDDW
tara:strand:- start:2279 stop:2608 length:330 start_codon:yes stop_codon:yes gene_type:complete